MEEEKSWFGLAKPPDPLGPALSPPPWWVFFHCWGGGKEMGVFNRTAAAAPPLRVLPL